jgi:hypothetical protein
MRRSANARAKHGCRQHVSGTVSRKGATREFATARLNRMEEFNWVDVEADAAA